MPNQPNSFEVKSNFELDYENKKAIIYINTSLFEKSTIREACSKFSKAKCDLADLDNTSVTVTLHYDNTKQLEQLAREFNNLLLTIPTKQQVDQSLIKKMKDVLTK